MKKVKKVLALLLIVVFAFSLLTTGCGDKDKKEEASDTPKEDAKEEVKEEAKDDAEKAKDDDAEEAKDDDAEEVKEETSDEKLKTDMATAISVGDYEPKKDEYYFAYTYKLIHPWYDAIKVGIDAAVAQYADKGVKITYDYTAPVTADAVEQINMIESAAAKNPDVVAIDVNQVDLTVPIISELTANGVKVLTFSGGDAVDSDRIAFIGNTDNKGDGAKLAEILAEAIGYEGEVACLDGTIGASSHEERIEGFNEVMAKYPDITVVDRQRDDDDLEKAVQLTEAFIQKHPNLKGIW
ncbi:MAG TPA: substrate-binding domain-containing protein [Clostridiaceae bacterium]|nr:substrate-binding domain-containing protein [Clostridiaceae bacterium]